MLKQQDIPASIPRNPLLSASEDYYALRRKGIELIAQMAGDSWTDYNAHDPGITLLEALCYALTDLGYRANWDIKDLLTPADASAFQPEQQALFSARQILTVNPWTIDDYRRLLIDHAWVANAWLIVRQCGCETQIFADCDHSRLAYQPADSGEVRVSPQGLYDVLLQLEQDPQLGDLNDRKLQHAFILKLDQRPLAITLELYFPEWDSAAWGEIDDYYAVADAKWLIELQAVDIKTYLQADGSDDVFSPQQQIQRWQQWARVFYADLTLKFAGNRKIKLERVPFRLFGSSEAQRRFKAVNNGWQLQQLLNFDHELRQAMVAAYLQKIAARQYRLQGIRRYLLQHRNLCEDFCGIQTVGVQDVAVCADIEVTQDADIEQILAQVLWAIEQYFNPRIAFYSLQERLAQGLSVDQIFEGPPLQHGFVDDANLAAAQLKSQIRTSDIINLLVDIPGVIAIRSLLLTRYDDQGQPVTGVADVAHNSDPLLTSARWTLQIDPRHQARLHTQQSKWLFYKNDLPFSPKASEVQDTLSQLRGQQERLKLRKRADEQPDDLPVPLGEHRLVMDFEPVQNSLPLCYGVGLEGLPPAASRERRAQAKQLKAYLLFFEQLLSNAEAQIANVGYLFSLGDANLPTYFFQMLEQQRIDDLSLILSSDLTGPTLQRLIETDSERLQRRNRFLDHLLARFAESFNEYALALYSSDRNAKPLSQQQLIQHKIAFLQQYPDLSRNRSRSFDYSAAWSSDNTLPLRQRLALLLGMNEADAQQILLIEHLLLRPKFSGDALMSICFDQPCPESCASAADPYSFQVTLVMPGWLAPFDDNIDLRRFADQTLQRELPAHILAKICWVSNWDYGEDWRDEFVFELAGYLKNHGKNAGEQSPSDASALGGAKALYAATLALFRKWIEQQVHPLNPAQLTQALFEQRLTTGLGDLGAHYSFAKNYASLTELMPMLAAYCRRMALADRWHQFDRIQKAWEDWLQQQRQAAHTETGMQEKLEHALYALNVAVNSPTKREQKACALLRLFANALSPKLKQTALQVPPASDAALQTLIEQAFEQVFADQGLQTAGVAQKHFDTLKQQFVGWYLPYLHRSRALWRLLLQLQQVHNSYPAATLHDCDEGGDRNPVRLGSTALGG